MADGNRVPDLGALSDSVSLLGVNGVGTTGIFPFNTLRNKISDYSSVSALKASMEPARGDGSEWRAGSYRYIENSAAPEGTYIQNSAPVPIKFVPLPLSGSLVVPEYDFAQFGLSTDENVDVSADMQAILDAIGPGIFIFSEKYSIISVKANDWQIFRGVDRFSTGWRTLPGITLNDGSGAISCSFNVKSGLTYVRFENLEVDGNATQTTDYATDYAVCFDP
ncbi:hypothetical protein, partial [Salipiger thiooxidans]|uniref:hypothetical protein n=1 Tax=Salipiger thiooxidans TaxID=282683 RepID=UPI001CD33C6E